MGDVFLRGFSWRGRAGLFISLAFWPAGYRRRWGRCRFFWLRGGLVESTAPRHGCRKQVRLKGIIRLFTHRSIKAKNCLVVSLGSRI